MAVQGPLARSAEDLELALDVVTGPDVGEDVAWRIEIPPARHEDLADYRVAVLPPIAWTPVDAEIMAALDRLATQLGRAGAQVKAIQPEGFGDLRDYCRLYLSIFWAMTSTGWPPEARQKQAQEFRAAGDELMDAYADGLEASASDYLIWFGQREHYRAAYRAFFQEWDVLLAPANVVNAFPHLDVPWPERVLKINDQTVNYNRQFVYPSLCNFSGQPGTAFPVGLTEAGLPIGLQAIGPYLEDRTSIRFAALTAQAFGGFHPPPGFDIG
jgi:amidase